MLDPYSQCQALFLEKEMQKKGIEITGVRFLYNGKNAEAYTFPARISIKSTTRTDMLDEDGGDAVFDEDGFTTGFDWAELGHTDLLPAGHQLATPELLFEKIEDATIEAQVQKLLDTKKANEEANYKANPIRPNIEFDDFTKLDIRVGTILECQKVPKADKLLQFKIDDGLETRTIVSGIAKHYQPEELVGKQVCFIANLAPRKLKGIVSEGMILSAENNDGSLAVIMPGREVKPGSEVK
jgi:methionine--tRNA ligase beta chain